LGFGCEPEDSISRTIKRKKHLKIHRGELILTFQGYDDSTWLEKLNSGSKRSRKVPDGMAEEVFIMEGSVTPSFSNSKKKGTWIRYPAGSDADLSATSDTMLYVRQYPIDMIIGS